ncbi:hypothetical protein CBW65_10760 [Tumebacillus avium]|uniref:Uncharacterized protein n=1 Tax=Tumebacillus avium TaxID=1903704 RepID=A0A1Y0ILN2_9BACL|nr:Ger(x)C family spore germination protein [Tumebacillus avium]ARU61431.1 hypothetical protein CBW65_10760 [Tumebacillus avium]
MKKRLKGYALLLCCLPLLSGCWDVKDINHRALPAAMAVDIGKQGGYIVWLKIPKIGGGQNEYIIAKGHHVSISKAIDFISTNLDRTIDLLHVKMIFLSEKLAKSDTSEVIDYALRTREIGNKTKLAVVQGDMNTFFESSKKSVAGSTGTSYDNFFSPESGWTPEVVRTSLWEAYRGKHSLTEDCLMPVVKKGTTTMLAVNGAALMKDGKKVGQLDLNESLVYNVFHGEFRGGIVQTLHHGAIRLLEAEVNNRTELQGARPMLHTKFKLTVTILERKSHVSDDVLIDDIRLIFKERYLHTLHKSQAAKSDVLGTGQFFRHHYSNAELAHWKNEQFQQLQADVDVDVIIRNHGMLRK